jgi:2,3-bisphosphoglycerate-independent phosphoglycerate mutase
MKYVIIIPDGAADDPLQVLADQTPLEAAATPNLDRITAAGKVAQVKTVPDGMTPGSDVATMSLLGYDPRTYYTGRAPIEAEARGIDLAPDDLVFRCNLVTISDGLMADFSGGHIGQAEADALIAELNAHLGDDRIRFHAGVSYRNLMVLKGGADMKIHAQPPHDIPGLPVRSHRPKGPNAKEVLAIMDRASELVANHEINRIRPDLGENPANGVWLWGQGRRPNMAQFKERYGLEGSVIAAVDLIRGIGLLIGWQVIDVEGATGYTDTNFAGKGAAAVEALEESDLVCVHVEAPDECGHNGDVAGKVTAIERIDEHVVGPVFEKLTSFEEHRILILPDHPTPLERRIHVDDPVPFAMAGTNVPHLREVRLTEEAGRTSDLKIENGWELMEYFLKSGL